MCPWCISTATMAVMGAASAGVVGVVIAKVKRPKAK
jgi:hypothetical protein